MSTDDNFETFRRAALHANIRTISATFSGSSDEGMVDSIGGPARLSESAEVKWDYLHTLNLETILLEDMKNLEVVGQKWYHYVKNDYVVYSEIKELIALADQHDVDIANMFSDILEIYNVDWINNLGGYGKVFLDLATGKYYIDGYARVESVEHEPESGVYFNAIIPVYDPAHDTSNYIKNLLQPLG
jgi:hypothetical protein